MTRIFLITIAVLALALLGSVRSCRQAVAKADGLERDRHALLDGITFYRTRDSLSAASVERLTLTKRELEKYCGDLAEDVKRLGLKVKHLQSASQTATETRYEIKTQVRDSVVYTGGSSLADSVQHISYADRFLKFDGMIHDGIFKGTIESRDTLTHIVHRVPRRFLCFRWGTKAVRMEVVSSNPHTKITYARYVELRK